MKKVMLGGKQVTFRTKISNSKQELARIISENGGWCNGEFAAQDGDGGVGGYDVKPEWNSLAKYWWREACGEWFFANKIKNHHQTVLSRAEYFHLYPAPDANHEFCESVMRAIPDPDKLVWTNPPSIEQLSADYRNAKDCAERKQKDADDAKADADEKLRVLELAGEAIGLLVSPITEKQEPGLVITDWRDLRVGDVIEVTGSSNEGWQKVKGKELTIKIVRSDGASTGEWLVRGNTEFRLIRRP